MLLKVKAPFPHPAKVSTLSRLTGIARSTLHRWEARPWAIPHPSMVALLYLLQYPENRRRLAALRRKEKSNA